MIDDGAGGAYDLLGEKNVPDLALEEETASGEGCESTDSSTDVIVELNPLSIPVKTIDLVQINDKQDSGIDGRPCRKPSMLYYYLYFRQEFNVSIESKRLTN